MTTEASRMVMRLANDARLLRGLAAAVEHFAQRAGFDEAGQQNLMAAAEEACRNTFKLVNGNDGTLDVVIEDFPDRVEVSVEHRGEPLPSAGLETFAGFSGSETDLSGLVLLSRVDRILYHTEGGTSRMTLVKYTHSSPKS